MALLKRARPDLRIGVVAEERFAGVFEGNPDIEEVLEPRVSAVRGFAPALALNLHGGTRSARLTALSGARWRAGFAIFRPGCVYNVRIPRAQEVLGVERGVHTAEHAAAAVFYLGVPVQEVPRATVAGLPGRSEYAPEGGYAVIHAVAATLEKTWPAERFAALARWLERERGLKSVFIGAAGDDLSAFAEFAVVKGAALGEMARLMRGAAFFAGNDSGPAHVAAACGVPSLVIFGPSDEAVWAPWRTRAEVLKSAAIGEIRVEAAMAAAGRLL